MKCNSKKNIKELFLEENIVDKNDSILNMTKFRAKNLDIRTLGQEKYSIYKEEPFEVSRGYIIYNDVFFNEIDFINESNIDPVDNLFHSDIPIKEEELKDIDETKLKDSQKAKLKNIKAYDRRKKEEDERGSLLNERHSELSPERKRLDKQILLLHEKLETITKKSNRDHAIFVKFAKKSKKQIEKKVVDKDIRKITDLNYYDSVLSYFDFISKTSSILEQLIELELNSNKKLNGKRVKSIWKEFKIIEGSYAIIEDVQDLLVELRRRGVISKEKATEVTELYKDIVSNISSINKQVQTLTKEFFIEEFGVTKYYQETLIKFKTASEKVAGVKFGIGSKFKDDRVKYVLDDIKDNIDHIVDQTKKDFRNLLESPGLDINYITGVLMSDATTNNPFVQFFSKVLQSAEVEYKNEIETKLLKLRALQDTYNFTDKTWARITEKDHKGISYLKGVYKAEYYSRFLELEEDIKLATNKKDKNKAIVKKEKFIDNNTKEVRIGKKPVIVPIDKWKNKIDNLTEGELVILQEFKDIIVQGSKATANRASLLRTNKEFIYIHDDMQFFELPKILETKFGKAKKGNLFGVLVKAIQEATVVEKDDVEEAMSIRKDDKVIRSKEDLSGKDENSLNINYRTEVFENQNMDLMTIFAKEIENMAKFKAQKSIEMPSLMFLDIVRDNKFYNTKGSTNKALRLALGKKLELEDYSKIKGENTELFKKLTSMLENNIYEITSKASFDIGKANMNRVTASFIAYSSYLSMAIRIPGAVNNFLIGSTNNFFETIGGEFFERKDVVKSNKMYFNNFGGILNDINSTVKTNIVNQIGSIYDIQGDYSQLNNEFERKSKLTQYAKSDNLFGLYSMGEHEMQTTLTLSVLSGIKVLNKNKEFIDINGKVVKNKSQAASLLDMYYIDESKTLDIRLLNGAPIKQNIKDKRVQLKEVFTYTTMDLINTFRGGGELAVKSLVKDRIYRTQGIYDTKRQSEFQRNWYGKLFLHFKKFFEAALMNRFRGVNNTFKKTDDLKDYQKFFNYASATEEYGYYVSFLRNLSNIIKQHQFQMLFYGNRKQALSAHEIANIRKANTEIVTTLAMISLALTFAMAAEAGDDDEALWAVALFARRQQNELTQYYLPNEMIRMVDNPIASMTQLKKLGGLATNLVNVFSYNDKYITGQNRGKYKIVVKTRNVLFPKEPLGVGVDYKRLYNFYENLN